MDFISNRSFKTTIEKQAAQFPEAPFVVYDNSTWKFHEILYNEMPDQIGKTCNAFLKLGISKGDRVNIHCSNCLEYVLSLFSLGCIGAIMVPTDISISGEEWEYVLEHTKPKLILTEPDFAGSLDKILGKCTSVQNVVLCKTKQKSKFLLFSDIISEAAAEIPDVAVSPEDDFAIYFGKENGSRHDGVVLAQANYWYWAEVISRTLKYTNAETIFEARQISNPMNQISSVLASFIAGARLFIADRFNGPEWIHQVGHFAPYLQKNMARGLYGFLDADQVRQVFSQAPTLRDGKNALKLLMYTGELNPEELTGFSTRFQTNLTRFFGMPECIMPLINPVFETGKAESIGSPTYGTKLTFIDESGKSLSAGPGRLAIIGTPGEVFFKGYYQNENRTAEVIKGDRFAMNFNVKCDEQGYLYVAA
ncbi:MAG: AMP-binding protein [Syntrophobacteraceae bacterium]